MFWAAHLSVAFPTPNPAAGAHLGAVFRRGAGGQVGLHDSSAEPQPAGKPRRPRRAAPRPAPCPLRPAAVTGGARPQSLRGSWGAQEELGELSPGARVVWLGAVPAMPLFLSQTHSKAASPSFFP